MLKKFVTALQCFIKSIEISQQTDKRRSYQAYFYAEIINIVCETEGNK